MTGDDKQPSLQAIYEFLGTAKCERAIREQFLPRWLPAERAAYDGIETMEAGVLDADAFIAHLTEGCQAGLQSHLLKQDPTLDSATDVDALRDAMIEASVEISGGTDFDALPTLSPPPTPEEIEAQIEEDKPPKLSPWEERFVSLAFGRPTETQRPQEPRRAYEGPFAAAYAIGETADTPAEDDPQRQEEIIDALRSIFRDRMDADLTERFLPEVLVPMVAARSGAEQDAPARPSSSASAVTRKHIPTASRGEEPVI